MFPVGRGLFVTGTDTGVGKTVVSAALMLRYRAEFPLMYWKPIQTGVRSDRSWGPPSGEPSSGPSEDDTDEVARLAACGAHELCQGGVRLPDPVSPHLASRLSGMTIDIAPLLFSIEEGYRYAGELRWIVEGAGGALVPINQRDLMIDLMDALALPVVVAARSTLGTINHTLLTLEALRRHNLRVAGVVMVGEPNDENRVAIERYGDTSVIGEMPRFAPLTPDSLRRWSTDALDREGTLRALMQ